MEHIYEKNLTVLFFILSVVGSILLYVYKGPLLNQNQIDTLIILGIICGCSALYCFIVGELSHNNSQMDKLWSILPAVYTWIIAIRGAMNLRLVLMAILATVWGIRLTYNFARKGAYHFKFWTGREDYRWEVLRNRKEFQPHWKWAIFNLLFISIYQNFLVLLITLPSVAVMNGENPLNWIDLVATFLFLFFLAYEILADEQQWAFQTTKWKMINEGKTLKELSSPYNKGFNTTGLWAYSRHPNYLGEQGIWLSFFVFTIGCGIFYVNWSILGSLLLIVLFIGSSAFAEDISLSKYSEYKLYQKEVSKFIPWKKYKR